MLDVKYFKDFNHNYLIINHKMDEKEQGYQHRMLSGNKIGHLLNCKIRYVNEECSFYYEISSKQSLKNLFDKKRMEYIHISDLLENIGEALEELDLFLLDSRYIIMMPEYIFAEPGSREYFFLYDPCAGEEDKQAAMMSLAEFLLDKVDREQENAVEIVYKIYESIQDNRFILPQILSWLHSFPAGSVEEDAVKEIWEKEETAIETDAWIEEEDLQRPGQNSDGEGRSYLAAVGIFSFLCAAAATAIVAIGYFFTLSVEEKFAATAGAIALVILSAFLFLYFILNILKRKNRAKIEIKEPVIEEQSTKSMEYKQAEEQGKQQEEYGNTVFLDTSAYKKENKLYGTNKGNKYHISLDRLPCTIGKMAGNVDVVIKDSTVSRIHARFTKQENKIYVTDMNSTNGTFKNGLRLEPNETVLIEYGDELRFGKMTFCYR